MKYNPLEDNFSSFESVEVPEVKITLPLFDSDFNISSWSRGVTNSGVPIAKNNLSNPMIVDNPTTTILTSYSDTNLTLEELLKQENIPIKITSSYRGSNGFRGGKTKQGTQSNHNKKDKYGNPLAYDIVPTNGNFEELLNKLYSNPRVVDWLRSKGYGILEEITPDIMKKTGATGKHLHIGPDSSAIAMTQKRLTAKAEKGLKFPFMSFESIEIATPTVKLPLFDQGFDVSEWSSRVTKDNIPIAKNNLQNPMTVDNPSPITSTEVSTNTNNSLSEIIDEVSNEAGYEELKNQEVKNLLMAQAKRESNFNQKVQARGSTASGYFQLIDSTRKQYSSVGKENFLNDPKEQVRTAYKLYKDIWNTPTAKQLLNKGYNKAQVTALGWWYPASMKMVLKGNTNFAKGGYSIKQALNDYKS